MHQDWETASAPRKGGQNIAEKWENQKQVSRGI